MSNFTQWFRVRLWSWALGAVIGMIAIYVVTALAPIEMLSTAPATTTNQAQAPPPPRPPPPPPSPASPPAPTSTSSDRSDDWDVVEAVAVHCKYVDENPAHHYTVDGAYPQIVQPRTRGTVAFNRAIRAFVLNAVREIDCAGADCSFDNGDASYVTDELSFWCDQLYVRSDVASACMTENFRTCGAAHPLTVHQSITMDLRTGTRLQLADVFRPGSRYLIPIAQACASDLLATYGDQGFDLHSGIESEGLRPVAKNYRTWNLTRDALEITFDEYQVVPHCYGTPSVSIPYLTLARLLRRDGIVDRVSLAIAVNHRFARKTSGDR